MNYLPRESMRTDDGGVGMMVLSPSPEHEEDDEEEEEDTQKQNTDPKPKIQTPQTQNPNLHKRHSPTVYGLGSRVYLNPRPGSDRDHLFLYNGSHPREFSSLDADVIVVGGHRHKD